MWLTSILGSVAGVWRGLPARWQGFILGTVVGVTVLSLSCGTSYKRAETIALQNALAATDSTRKLVAHRDTVYARLLAQKDVQLAGALASVARKQGDKPRAVVTVTARGRSLDTTVSHPRGNFCCRTVPHDSVSRPWQRDSLVLPGPPVQGVVTATVTDSTWIWSARLRPSPVDITLAITCGKKGAEILGTGPPGVPWSIGYKGGVVDPTLCNPKPSQFGRGVRTGVLLTGATYVVLRLFHVIH
jgi:hypothetical protein